MEISRFPPGRSIFLCPCCPPARAEQQHRGPVDWGPRSLASRRAASSCKSGARSRGCRARRARPDCRGGCSARNQSSKVTMVLPQPNRFAGQRPAEQAAQHFEFFVCAAQHSLRHPDISRSPSGASAWCCIARRMLTRRWRNSAHLRSRGRASRAARRPVPTHLHRERDVAGVDAIGLDRHRAHRRLHVPGVDADHRKARRGQAVA